MGAKRPTFALVPGQKSRRVSLEISSAISSAVDKFEKDLGGRGALVAALSVTDLTRDIAAIVSILGDPANDLRPLAEICADYKIAPAELLGAYKQAILARSQLLSLSTVAVAAPKVVEDLAGRAVEHQGLCVDCNGTGKVSRSVRDSKGVSSVETSNCLVCSGVGTVRRLADTTAQDRILDMVGLMPKSGGMAIGISTTINNPGSGGSDSGTLVDLQAAVGKVLARTGSTSLSASGSAASVVEAEVIPPTISSEA